MRGNRGTLAIYPNPVAARAVVQWEEPLAEPGVFTVYDAVGRLVYQAVLGMGAMRYELDVKADAGGALPPGQYFVSVRSDARVITGSLTILQ